MKSSKNGFTFIEGLTAFSGLLISIIVAIYGIGLRPLLFVYILGVVIFFTIYYRKLCVTCKKSCPFNPDMRFWKERGEINQS